MKHPSAFLVLAFGLLAALPARASGFYLQEQSVSGQGAAYAGAAANPQDASTIFYNPAGLTALPGSSFSANASIVTPRAKFRDTGTTGGLNAGAQAPIGGTNGGEPYTANFLPALYAASQIPGTRYWIGLGVTSPFGLANNYGGGWFGRYDSIKSVLHVTDVSPVLAAQVTDTLSIGGGPDFQYASGSLQSALPCPGAGFACGAVFSPASDGLSRLDGESWAMGYNLGLQWRATPATTIGAFYRSAIIQELRGTARVSGLGGGLAGLNGVQAATAKLKLPDVASLAVSRKMSDRLTLLGGANWYGWENFSRIDVKFPSGAADNVTPENYHNSYSLHAGAEWRQTDQLKLRLGTQFDQTPTSSARTTRTPDSNRVWLSGGFGYALGGGFSVDAAYSHVFMGDSHVDIAKGIYAAGAATTVNVHGVSTNQIDIVSLQATARF
jgi:long-chain fatty acid transport protein